MRTDRVPVGTLTRDLHRVARAAEAVGRAIVKRDDAIRKARAHGRTLEAIGAAAGLTKQRVHQLTSSKPSTDHEGSTNV